MKNNSVAVIMDNYVVAGDYGIEIEMETNRSVDFHDDFDDYIWNPDYDEHSLKGAGIEVYLRDPIPYKNVRPLIKKTKERLDNKGLKIKNSVRAGVHIHMNVQPWTLDQVYKFLQCYYPLETVLTNFAGDGRQGNLFCLRAQDAGNIIPSITKAVSKEKPLYYKTDDLRYSALNLQSLFTHGSLEFRALSTIPSLDNIPIWVDMIESLKNYSLTKPDILSEIQKISFAGPEPWLKKIFGPVLFDKLKYEGMEQDVMADIRECQILLHTINKKGI